MKQIIDYVEVMFKELPKTKEVIDMKADILSNMIDRYELYIEEGVDSNEAIGRVIGSFGSIDDIKEALNLELDVEYADTKTIEDYLDYIPTFSKLIASGVGLVLLGASLVAGVTEISHEKWAIIVLLLFVMISVCAFIYGGIRLAGYHIENQKSKVYLDETTNYIKGKIDGLKHKFTMQLIAGIGFIFFAVISYVILEDTVLISINPSGIFMAIIAVGTFLIIDGSIPYGACHALLEANTKLNVQETRFEEITGLIMGITAMVYVVAGLLKPQLFGILWVMFPIVALSSELIGKLTNKE